MLPSVNSIPVPSSHIYTAIALFSHQMMVRLKGRPTSVSPVSSPHISPRADCNRRGVNGDWEVKVNPHNRGKTSKKCLLVDPHHGERDHCIQYTIVAVIAMVCRCLMDEPNHRRAYSIRQQSIENHFNIVFDFG